METDIAQVNTAPFSPPSSVCDPNPDKVDITAVLHMASLVDAHRSHSGCPPPPSLRLRRPRPPRDSIAQDVYQHIFDRGGRTDKPFQLCQQRYLQAASVDAAVFAMCWSSHLPESTLDGRQGSPGSPAPATPHTDFTCPWCPSEVPSSAWDLPWLHIIHRLLLCPAGQGRPHLNFVQKCCY
jgi:hypothetical protein